MPISTSSFSSQTMRALAEAARYSIDPLVLEAVMHAVLTRLKGDSSRFTSHYCTMGDLLIDAACAELCELCDLTRATDADRDFIDRYTTQMGGSLSTAAMAVILRRDARMQELADDLRRVRWNLGFERHWDSLGMPNDRYTA